MKRCEEKLYLIHFEKSSLAHLLESTDFTGFLLPGKEDFTISTLTDLSDNMELIDLELRPSFSEDYSFAATVRFEFFDIFIAFECARSRIIIKSGSSILSCGNISQELKVIIKKV